MTIVPSENQGIESPVSLKTKASVLERIIESGHGRTGKPIPQKRLAQMKGQLEMMKQNER